LNNHETHAKNLYDLVVPITSGREFQAPGQFATTRWSLIVSARSPVEPTSRKALSELCQVYWYPLYAVPWRAKLPTTAPATVSPGAASQPASLFRRRRQSWK
jgi:hypothetical protein